MVVRVLALARNSYHHRSGIVMRLPERDERFLRNLWYDEKCIFPGKMLVVISVADGADGAESHHLIHRIRVMSSLRLLRIEAEVFPSRSVR